MIIDGRVPGGIGGSGPRPSPGRFLALALILGLVALGANAGRFCSVNREALSTLDGEEIAVSLREVDGSNAKEGCALGVIDAPVEQVFAVLDDPGRFGEFMPHVEESEVEEGDGGVVLNHQVLDLPFPIRNRHYTVRLQSRPPAPELPDRWEIIWSYVPGSGNVNENEGAWTLLRLSEERTLAAYRVHTDPGGLIPKWALNRVIRKTLPDVIRAIRRRVAEIFSQTPSPPSVESAAR